MLYLQRIKMNCCVSVLCVFYLLQVINCHEKPTKSYSNNEHELKITDGYAAKLGQFSWQAGITVKFKHGEIFCSGALISPEWILTSATCVNKNAIEWNIVLGTTRRTSHSEGAFTTTGLESIAHEGFNQYYNNNIGLIKVAKLPIRDTRAIKPIQLQTRKNATDNLNNKRLTVSGWGRGEWSSEPYTEWLRYTTVSVIANEECVIIFGKNIVVDETMCLQNKYFKGNICEGDNGDPLVMYKENGTEPILVGISSFIPVHGCTSMLPTGFTRIGSYLDWIHKHTNIAIIDQ